MLAPPEADLHDDSGLSSIFFLSYDRGQTTSTSRHCSSAAIENGGTRAHQAIEYQEKEDRVASSSSKTVSILDLPLDMLHNITRRLTVVGDYRSLHSSCKTLRSIAPLMTTLDGLALQSPSTYPWFFFFQHHTTSLHLHDLRCRNTFTNPRQLLPKSPSSNSTTCIVFSKERWLLTCMEHDIFEPAVNPLPQPVFLFTFWNPFTEEVWSVPEMIYPPSPISIGVSAAPTSPHCSIMGVAQSMKDYGGIWFHFLKLNEGQWHYLEDAEANFEPSDHNTPVFLDDKFYFLDKKRKLGVFNCRSGVEGLYEWERDVYPWKLLSHHVVDPNEDLKFKREYLVECEGEIMSILVGDLGKSILVYRFDRQKKGWWRVNSLGSNMVFLSNTSCFSTMAKISGMENKIYFPRLSAKGSIVFYLLDTHKYHTFDYDDAMEDFLPTSEVHICGWIEPKG
ncbi:unnamed protein product [Linum trigynum]|uniref:KIB1-4 beta-propeller domain-containing protein n=1 Tax=Linum trigynum TaxID=586398 RepID=A0AAV2DK60_9ROSI